MKYEKLMDKNNSPIQLVSQLKGLLLYKSFFSYKFSYNNFLFYRYTPFNRIFWKQMVLSAALDNGYIFIVLNCYTYKCNWWSLLLKY